MDDQEPSTTVHWGFAPIVKGAKIDMKNAGALAVVSQGDVNVREGGAQIMLAGGDLSIEQGGAQAMLARGDIAMRDAGAMLVAGSAVEVTDGWVGIALGGRVDIRDSRVLLGPVQALGVGAGFAIVVTLARRIFSN